MSHPIIDAEPGNLNDGIEVGSLAASCGDTAAVLNLTRDIDSLLIMSRGKLVLES